jgi:aerobic carbon-monoxide dehydrogenase medium subunit
MIPAEFDYLAPTSVEEAIAALAEHGDDAKVLAGGQSLLPVLRMRLNAPEVVIDLGRIESLRGVRDDGDVPWSTSPMPRSVTAAPSVAPWRTPTRPVTSAPRRSRSERSS